MMNRNEHIIKIVTFKTLMMRLNLRDYNVAYIHVKATITVPNTTAAAATVNDHNKKLIFKNCAPYTNCISEINNTQVTVNNEINNAQNIDIDFKAYVQLNRIY